MRGADLSTDTAAGRGATPAIAACRCRRTRRWDNPPRRAGFRAGVCGCILALILSAPWTPSHAGAQQYEPLAASVRAALSRAIADRPPKVSSFTTEGEAALWLAEMSRRMERRMPDGTQREEFLRSLHYEATRAGLDPQLVLGLVQVESGFRKYAVSTAGARGYMQVMPFWQRLIGRPDDNLFSMRTNLRFGCTILRHYLDIERGDLFRALGRYNGSLGLAEYPNMVRGAWQQHWNYTPQPVQTASR